MSPGTARLPPFVDRTSYHQGIEWKRSLHRTHGTRLIETYSYQRREGTLLTSLEAQLRELQVPLRPISSQEALQRLRERKRIGAMTQLATTFLNHFKGSGKTIAAVQASIGGPDAERARAFLNVFEPLLERYEQSLRRSGFVDFNDMILGAARHAETRRFVSPYTTILVDEFQDISAGRARLIKALADQSPSHRLFCVGDDWQSIYRFAGSDIALMRDFEQHFGPTETVMLDQTFRFNSGINGVATRFVLTNPAQIRKDIYAPRPVVGAAVVIHRANGADTSPVLEALAEIQDRTSDAASVLILGRYRFTSDGLPWSEMRRFPRLRVEFKTIHGSKGLEADYVVVLGMRSGENGFPSEATDDPLLDLVLAVPEAFPFAEERRLFYVALTRARHRVHIVADPTLPSTFVTEIQRFGLDVDERGGAIPTPVSCPRCKRGVLIQRRGEHGVFYGCSRYPQCAYQGGRVQALRQRAVGCGS